VLQPGPHEVMLLIEPTFVKSNEIGVAEAVPLARLSKPIAARSPPHLNLFFMIPDSL
jgi:hypothetical protein